MDGNPAIEAALRSLHRDTLDALALLQGSAYGRLLMNARPADHEPASVCDSLYSTQGGAEGPTQFCHPPLAFLSPPGSRGGSLVEHLVVLCMTSENEYKRCSSPSMAPWRTLQALSSPPSHAGARDPPTIVYCRGKRHTHASPEELNTLRESIRGLREHALHARQASPPPAVLLPAPAPAPGTDPSHVPVVVMAGAEPQVAVSMQRVEELERVLRTHLQEVLANRSSSLSAGMSSSCALAGTGPVTGAARLWALLTERCDTQQEAEKLALDPDQYRVPLAEWVRRMAGLRFVVRGRSPRAPACLARELLYVVDFLSVCLATEDWFLPRQQGMLEELAAQDHKQWGPWAYLLKVSDREDRVGLSSCRKAFHACIQQLTVALPCPLLKTLRLQVVDLPCHALLGPLPPSAPLLASLRHMIILAEESLQTSRMEALAGLLGSSETALAWLLGSSETALAGLQDPGGQQQQGSQAGPARPPMLTFLLHRDSMPLPRTSRLSDLTLNLPYLMEHAEHVQQRLASDCRAAGEGHVPAYLRGLVRRLVPQKDSTTQEKLLAGVLARTSTLCGLPQLGLSLVVAWQHVHGGGMFSQGTLKDAIMEDAMSQPAAGHPAASQLPDAAAVAFRSLEDAGDDAVVAAYSPAACKAVQRLGVPQLGQAMDATNLSGFLALLLKGEVESMLPKRAVAVERLERLKRRVDLAQGLAAQLGDVGSMAWLPGPQAAIPMLHEAGITTQEQLAETIQEAMDEVEDIAEFATAPLADSLTHRPEFILLQSPAWAALAAATALAVAVTTASGGAASAAADSGRARLVVQAAAAAAEQLQSLPGLQELGNEAILGVRGAFAHALRVVTPRVVLGTVVPGAACHSGALGSLPTAQATMGLQEGVEGMNVSQEVNHTQGNGQQDWRSMVTVMVAAADAVERSDMLTDGEAGASAPCGMEGEDDPAVRAAAARTTQALLAVADLAVHWQLEVSQEVNRLTGQPFGSLSHYHTATHTPTPPNTNPAAFATSSTPLVPAQQQQLLACVASGLRAYTSAWLEQRIVTTRAEARADQRRFLAGVGLKLAAALGPEEAEAGARRLEGVAVAVEEELKQLREDEVLTRLAAGLPAGEVFGVSGAAWDMLVPRAFGAVPSLLGPSMKAMRAQEELHGNQAEPLCLSSCLDTYKAYLAAQGLSYPPPPATLPYASSSSAPRFRIAHRAAGAAGGMAGGVVGGVMSVMAPPPPSLPTTTTSDATASDDPDEGPHPPLAVLMERRVTQRTAAPPLPTLQRRATTGGPGAGLGSGNTLVGGGTGSMMLRQASSPPATDLYSLAPSHTTPSPEETIEFPLADDEAFAGMLKAIRELPEDLPFLPFKVACSIMSGSGSKLNDTTTRLNMLDRCCFVKLTPEEKMANINHEVEKQVNSRQRAGRAQASIDDTWYRFCPPTPTEPRPEGTSQYDWAMHWVMLDLALLRYGWRRAEVDLSIIQLTGKLASSSIFTYSVNKAGVIKQHQDLAKAVVSAYGSKFRRMKSRPPSQHGGSRKRRADGEPQGAEERGGPAEGRGGEQGGGEAPHDDMLDVLANACMGAGQRMGPGRAAS